MAAVKRLDATVRIGVPTAQSAWLKQQADSRHMSVAAVVRELIQAAMRKEVKP